MAEVEVAVAGRSYRLACRDGDESDLLMAAARLDETATRLARSLGAVAESRLLLMAALLVTGQLIEGERKGPAEGSPGGQQPAERALETLAWRIERLAARLEAAAGLETSPADT
jgi:cell division protein ZapA